MFKPSDNCLTDRSKAVLLLCILFVFVCHTFLSVPCNLVVTCWERADLLALLYMVLSCVFVIFPYGVLGQVYYLSVLIPDLCLLTHFNDTLRLYYKTDENLKKNLDFKI